MSAVLSPDRAHIGATLAVGCGLSPSIVAPTQGGTPRYIDGSSDVAPGRHVQSYVLGWSWQGKLVAEFARGECEKESTPGIYLVDPRTYIAVARHHAPPRLARLRDVERAAERVGVISARRAQRGWPQSRQPR